MPELPEVESLTRHIRKIAEGRLFVSAKFYRRDLREAIPIKRFTDIMNGQLITKVHRRSKYLLMETASGVGIFHLGMSGKILAYQTAKPQLPHTHAVFTIKEQNGTELFLHFIDPRRFGIISCAETGSLGEHRYFAKLGPEPLEHPRLGAYLGGIARNRKVNIKSFIMNAQNVVGVGNIYASESLFLAKLHPDTPANHLDQDQWHSLAKCIKSTLRKAIKAGGTTFSDFQNPDGDPGYFRISLQVYGREGAPCYNCQSKIIMTRHSNRATFFCSTCQPPCQ